MTLWRINVNKHLNFFYKKGRIYFHIESNQKICHYNFCDFMCPYEGSMWTNIYFYSFTKKVKFLFTLRAVKKFVNIISVTLCLKEGLMWTNTNFSFAKKGIPVCSWVYKDTWRHKQYGTKPFNFSYCHTKFGLFM